jgi:exopolysaccharide production protein ExoZ
MQKHRVAFMQTMRAAAAALVVAFHSGRELAKGQPDSRLLDFFSICDFGVDIFFVISGFIMYYVTVGEAQGLAAAKEFFLKRVNRIVPMYWLFTTLFILPLLLVPSVLNRTGVSIPYIVSSYLFVPWQRPDEAIPSVSPMFGLGWTLNFEMLFYLSFAVLIALRVRRPLPVFVLLFGGLCLIGEFVSPKQAQLFFWTRTLLLEFVAGAAIAALYCRRGGRGFLPAAFGAGMIAAGIALWLVFGYLLPVHNTVVDLRGVTWGFAAALIIAGFAWSEPLATGLAGATGRLGQLLGDASFSLYLCHLFVVRTTSIILRKLHLAGFAPLFVLGNMIAAAIASVIVYRLIERPLTKAGGRLLLPRRAVTETAPLPNSPA